MKKNGLKLTEDGMTLVAVNSIYFGEDEADGELLGTKGEIEGGVEGALEHVLTWMVGRGTHRGGVRARRVAVA